MTKPIFKKEALKIILIFIAGALLHFVFGWSGEWKPLGFIAPVNESVFEHLKMVLWPVLLYAIFEYRHLKTDTPNFWLGKASYISISIIFIVAIFYIYTPFTGHSILAVDILTFLLSILLGEYVNFKITTSSKIPSWLNNLAVPLLLVIILMFIIFTYYPPHLPIFKDPRDGTYGIRSVLN